MKKFYVYRFLDKSGNILYVGRTSDLNRRLNSHFNNKSKTTTARNKKVENIQFVTFEFKTYSALYEIYLINIWKPQYNKFDKYNEVIPETLLNLSDLIWENVNPELLQCQKNKIKSDEERKMRLIRKVSLEEEQRFLELEKEGIVLNPSQKKYIVALMRKGDGYLETSDLMHLCNVSYSTHKRISNKLLELGLIGIEKRKRGGNKEDVKIQNKYFLQRKEG